LLLLRTSRRPVLPVRLSVDDDVARIWLDDPSSRNALSRSTYHELGRIVAQVVPRDDVRFIVLRGAEGLFSSGGDLKELASGLGPQYLPDYWSRMSRVIAALRQAPQVVISVVEGVAAGAGASLALAADIVIAESAARFRWNFVWLGLMPDAGATQILPRSLGWARARDYLLTGKWMSAPDALTFGLISRVATAAEVDTELLSLLTELRKAPAPALALAKNLLADSDPGGFENQIRREGVYQLAAALSSDVGTLATQVLHESRSVNEQTVDG
jgi:enoyl-CoA hydratase/carnithine racemase